jgi:hypothetical protein
MVNRETNFNRKKVKKSKVIRDKWKNRSNLSNARRTSPQVPEESPTLSKKQLKRQKRLAQIYKQLDATETENRNTSQRYKRRRNKTTETEETNNNLMQD